MAGLKQVFVQGLTERSTTEKDVLGDIRWEGNKCFKYVEYEQGAAAVAGVAKEVCYYFEDSGHTDHKVTSDLSDATGDVGAGVLQAALADGEFGWIQIKGRAILTIALTAGSDGNVLTPTGAGDGTLDVVVTTVALSHNGCAIAVDDSANEIICDFPF